VSKSSFLDYWNEFWYKPGSTLNLALYRLVFGVITIWYLLVFIGPDLKIWFGPERVISLAANFRAMQFSRLDLLLLLPDTDAAVFSFWLIILLAAVFYTVGFLYRISSVILFLGLISFHHHAIYYCNCSDILLRLFSFFMCLAPANKVLSVDALVFAKRPLFDYANAPQSSLWIQRLMQVQLCAVYFDCFWSKAVGIQWWNGQAIYNVTHLEHLARVPFGFLTQFPVISTILGLLVIATEFSLAFLVWFRKLRYPVLFAGLLLHTGMEFTLFIPLFQYLFVSTFLIFIYPEDLEKVFNILVPARKLNA